MASRKLHVPTARSQLQDWQEHFASIYRSSAGFGGPTPDYAFLQQMWLGVVEGMRHLAKAIRKSQVSSLIDYLPQMFCLLCGSCTLAGIRLDDAAWEFFPYVCPTCWKRPCICGSSKFPDEVPAQKNDEMLRVYRAQNQSIQPHTPDEYVAMFASIYQNHPDSTSFVHIYLHLSEEVAEVAQHVREVQQDQDNSSPLHRERERSLRSEIADVFSWLCKLSWRVDLEWQGFLPWIESRSLEEPAQFKKHRGPRLPKADRQILFSSLLTRRYRGGCPKCRKIPCDGSCGPWGTLCTTDER
jgi:NTP pyrophosphatase (non-canonical NTP hydrolase)